MNKKFLSGILVIVVTFIAIILIYWLIFSNFKSSSVSEVTTTTTVRNEKKENLTVENIIKHYKEIISKNYSGIIDVKNLDKLLVSDFSPILNMGLINMDSVEFLRGINASNIGKGKPNTIEVKDGTDYEDIMTEAICGPADVNNTNSANPTKIVFNLNEKKNLVLFIGMTGVQQFDQNNLLVRFFSDKMEKEKLYTTKVKEYFLFAFDVPKEKTRIGSNTFELSVPDNTGKNGWTQIDFISILSTQKDEPIKVISEIEMKKNP